MKTKQTCISELKMADPRMSQIEKKFAQFLSKISRLIREYIRYLFCFLSSFKDKDVEEEDSTENCHHEISQKHQELVIGIFKHTES
jgi:hypothetical protein